MALTLETACDWHGVCARELTSLEGCQFDLAARVKVSVVVDAQRDAEFDRAFELLRDLVDWSAADREFSVRGNSVYTISVVLWMLVSQRMNPKGSLVVMPMKMPSLAASSKPTKKGTSKP